MTIALFIILAVLLLLELDWVNPNTNIGNQIAPLVIILATLGSMVTVALLSR